MRRTLLSQVLASLLRSAILVATLFLAVRWESAHAGEGPKLVEVFCSQMVSEVSPPGDFAKEWNHFSEQLESRTLISNLESDLSYKEQISRCVSKYDSRFERGEFFLQGLELLKAEKRERPLALAQASMSLSIGSNIPYLKDLGLLIPDTEFTPRNLVEDRRVYYETHWQSFLKEIQKDWLAYRTGHID